MSDNYDLSMFLRSLGPSDVYASYIPDSVGYLRERLVSKNPYADYVFLQDSLRVHLDDLTLAQVRRIRFNVVPRFDSSILVSVPFKDAIIDKECSR